MRETNPEQGSVGADAIDALLPQTQCGKCGYNGCRPYAEAIAANEADINQCPPGGEAGIRTLAELLGRPAKPLDPTYGSEQPAPVVAWVDEAACIGCTLCIQACPVDAIVGAAKQMHTIITAECTGCELCIPPCPVDCIHLRELDPAAIADEQQARQWRRARFESRNARLARDAAEQAERRQRKREALSQPKAAEDQRKAVIAAALERVRRKKAQQAAAKNR
jgi:electron transport complex protein RnfB